jgi:hypothetical protein
VHCCPTFFFFFLFYIHFVHVSLTSRDRSAVADLKTSL